MTWPAEDSNVRPDLLIVGGGLAGGLLALRLTETRPELDWRLVEAGPRLGGNHTWSFHEGDLSSAMRAAIEPAIARCWPAYEVRFPDLERRLERPYHTVTSASRGT